MPTTVAIILPAPARDESPGPTYSWLDWATSSFRDAQESNPHLAESGCLAALDHVGVSARLKPAQGVGTRGPERTLRR